MYEIIYRDLLSETGEVPKVTCRIGMAQFAVPQDTLEETGRGLFSLRADHLKAVRSRVRDLVERAGENGVNVLVFPEMAIDLNHAELLHDLLKLAQTYGMVIVPGSYHDLDTRRNVCRVLGLKGILWEQDKHIPAVMRFGKHTVEEGITPAPARRITVCDTPFGRMAVAICRDFLDLDLRVELKNFNPAVDIILNPAMTPVTADFEAAHFEARRSIYAYCFFCNVSEFGNSAINTPEKDRKKRIIPPGKEELLWKDVDLFSLRAERKKWEKLGAGREGFIQSTRSRVISQHSSNIVLESAIPTDQIALNAAEPGQVSAVSKPIQSASHSAPNDRDQPSIAVLPLVNMSGDPEQEYFSDGITEDLITDLSKLIRLSVTARTSAFTYKGKAVNVKQIGAELGVRYVLEGSVRKAENRVRITAQLIETDSGNHIWAERYDRTLEDIFEVQDEITRNIVTALDVKLIEGEQANIWRKSTQSAEAYDLFLRGQDHYRHYQNTDGIVQARRFYEQAIDLDPRFARAIAGLAHTYSLDAILGASVDTKKSLEISFKLADRAIALDDSLAYAHSVIGMNYVVSGQYDRAIAKSEQAVRLNPNSGDIVARLGVVETWCGKPESGIRNIRKAMHLTPRHPPWYLRQLGVAQMFLEQYEDAINSFREAITRAPNSVLAHIYLASTYAAVERDQEAQSEVQEILRLEPGFSLQRFQSGFVPRDKKQGDRNLDLLRKAGLPE